MVREIYRETAEGHRPGFGWYASQRKVSTVTEQVENNCRLWLVGPQDLALRGVLTAPTVSLDGRHTVRRFLDYGALRRNVPSTTGSARGWCLGGNGGRDRVAEDGDCRGNRHATAVPSGGYGLPQVQPHGDRHRTEGTGMFRRTNTGRVGRVQRGSIAAVGPGSPIRGMKTWRADCIRIGLSRTATTEKRISDYGRVDIALHARHRWVGYSVLAFSQAVDQNRVRAVVRRVEWV